MASSDSRVEVAASVEGLLTAAEREQVLHGFNDTAVAYRRDRLIHELFEEQVQRTPDAIALAFEQQFLTYAELNGRSNQLARYLKEKGVGPDQLVGICVERSLEMVIGLLGILKARGAYVPLDPNYPIERLKYMLADAAPQVLLTQASLQSTLSSMAAEVIAIDGVWREISQWEDGNLDAPSLQLSSRHLAYVIYTSGSTGDPKGVMVEHAGVVNFLTSMQQNPGISATDCMLAITTMSFDIAALEIYLPLINGAKVVLASREAASDVRLLMAMLEEFDITVLQATPATWQLLLSGGWSGRSTLKALCGGEALTTDLSGKLVSRVQALWNLYGPTETTIWSCGRQIPVPDERGSVESIGRPIANTRVYMLDHDLKPVPIGVAGEIYIGGAGLARGYLYRPQLTAERFIADPFSDDPQGRLYKTGDLGRWRADGTIEYLGRNDHQVKIRGYRIELGEIEGRLVRHAQVKQAVVIAREDVPGEKRLVAYVIPCDPLDAQAVPNVETLRAHLKAVLPEYMVPSAFVMLDRYPLTPNGKLDRRALPPPELGAYASRQYEAPQGEVEELLAGIWQKLLRIERVGRQDNFFELGGHSLLIVQMLDRLRGIGLSAEVQRVFESPTLADLASWLTTEAVARFDAPPNLISAGCLAITPQMLPLLELEAEHIDRIAQAVPWGVANIQDIYPLTPLQEGMLFHHLLDEQRGDVYVVTTLLSLSSRERLEEFIRALQAVINRHDVLRTAVLWEKLPRPIQVVYRQGVLPVEEIAGRHPMEQMMERMRLERPGMDLRQAPLMRLRVAADNQGIQWYALLQVHHIVCDNESLETMVSEVIACLESPAHGLPEPVPYRIHVAQALARAVTHDAGAFFRRKLGEIDEPTAPFGLVDVHGDGSRREQARQTLDPALARRVRVQAQRLGMSAAVLFHAAWALVVSLTTGRNDVVYGTVLLGRLQSTAGAQRMLGIFINTLPLRLRLQDVTTRELVEQTQRELMELLTHEQASLALAQRCSAIVGSAPLFSALLNYLHSSPHCEAEQPMMASGVQVLASQEWTNYPIVLSVEDQGETIVLTLQTDQRINPHRLMGYTSTAIESLVGALTNSPHMPAVKLPILPEREQYHLLESFNDTQAAYPQEKLSHELFEEQVERTPNVVAVVYEGQALTYAELNGRANQLAHYLNKRGVQIGDYIPILMPRCLQMLIAQLAVIKSGGVYVPVDPQLPVERQAFVIRDCAAQWILAEQDVCEGLEREPLQWIDCAEVNGAISALPRDNLRLQMDAPPPAYVMYTSGSTGFPKGVVVPHRAVNRLVINNKYAQIQSTDCIAHCSNPTFDASTFEIWGALLNGASVLIVPQEVVLEAGRFAEVLREQRVTVLWLTVGLLTQYTEALTPVFGQLRYLLTGGDIVEPGMIRRLMSRSAPQYLLNAYGPTECTTFSTTYLIEAVDEDTKSIPIGRPITNTQIYILDSQLRPVPIGVTGEIYIGGAGVALGYLNRPELTAERFISDPFSTDPRARLYKSGDLGRWRADGNVEFLGRNDQQVKLRGFRIELGEIEAHLARHAQVKEALVVAREDVPGDKFLVAYLTMRVESHPNIEGLRAHLKALLPEYMVPSAFVILESLPLTPNGKLDRRALPSPELGAYVNRRYENPEGEVEEVMAEIWRELLRVERVGREDNFFELGGHSLLAMQVIVRTRSSWSLDMPVRALFEFPTLKQLSNHVHDLRQARLLDEFGRGGSDIDELVESVASLPEGEVEELIRLLRMGVRP